MSETEHRQLSTGRKLLLALITTALILGGVEIALRVVLPYEDLLFSWERPDNLIRVQLDGQIGVHQKVADSTWDGPRKWRHVTNSQGFRESEETQRDIPPGTYRILALGDSFIFGVNANQGRDLTGQLEELLPERLGVARVEVVNIGVVGASAFDVLTYWRRYSPQYEYDGVLLGQPHNPGRQEQVEGVRDAWYHSVKGPPAVDIRLYMALRRFWAPYAMPTYVQPDDQQTWQRMRTDLSQIVKEVHEQGKPSWMVLWNTRWEHVDENNQRLDPGPWQEAFSPYKTRLAGHNLGQRSCWGYVDTGHPSEAGYRATAEIMAPVIAGEPVTSVVFDEPSCDDVEGDGPGKPGSYPVPTGRSPRSLHQPITDAVRNPERPAQR